MRAKNTVIIIGVLLVRLLYPNTVIAQEIEEIGIGQTQEIFDPALILSMSSDGQEYPSKKFPVVLSIDSKIDSGKAGIEWIYPDDMLKLEGDNNDVITITSDHIATVTQYFVPLESAVLESKKEFVRKLEIGAKVKAVVPGRSYLSSTLINIEFDNEMERVPVDSDFRIDKYIYIGSRWALEAGKVLLIVAVVAWVIKKFINYLNNEQK